MLVSVNVHVLVAGVAVAIVVQLARDKFERACSVRRKYGMVLRTTVTELVGVMEMEVKMGAVGAGRVALAPLNVTAVDANALPTIVLLVAMVTAVPAIMVP
jgi:hypothetical protein